MDFFVCFSVLLFLSTSKGQAYDKLPNKRMWEDDKDSTDAWTMEWRICYQKNLVQIPEHKTGKSALFSVAATRNKNSVSKRSATQISPHTFLFKVQIWKKLYEKCIRRSRILYQLGKTAVNQPHDMQDTWEYTHMLPFHCFLKITTVRTQAV